jgi:hypothetical protein
MARTRILGICAAGVALVVAGLFLGGQKYRADSYRAVSPDAHRLREAKCMIHLFETDQIREDSIFFKSQRPKDTCCMVTVFAFNPAYTSIRVNQLNIELNGTNVAQLTDPSTIDTNDLVFKPYIDKEAFRAEFPHQDPREALFAFFPSPTTTPLLARAPEVGSKMRVAVSLEILSGNGIVLSTNVQTDFMLAREERRYTWAEMLFVRVFMPRF